MICEVAAFYIWLRTALCLCALIVSDHNTTQEGKEAFIAFIENGFVNLRLENTGKAVQNEPLGFVCRFVPLERPLLGNALKGRLIRSKFQIRILYPLLLVPIPSSPLLKLIAKRNKKDLIHSIYIEPPTATFLSALAYFIGEEFREDKDAEVSQIRASSFSAFT